MIEELKRIEDSLLKINGLNISNLIEDLECEEYLGFNFQIGHLNIKFRKSKITPKKMGQFVTLWRRNLKKETEPFNVTDKFDFYIVATEQNNEFGFFLFSKDILNEKQILTNLKNEGKRGFRVYPDWSSPENLQAKKTKMWQTNYFIDLTNNKDESIKKFNSILNTTVSQK